MVRKACAPEQEAKHLQLRATEQEVRTQRARVRDAIRNCPSVLPHLISCMESLGYTKDRLVSATLDCMFAQCGFNFGPGPVVVWAARRGSKPD